MPTFTHYVWNNEKIGFPPAERKVTLAYYNPDKISMSFYVDFTPAGETYLDPVKGIRINGKIAQIPDLPENPMRLRLLDRSNIDVTSLVQSGPPGMENHIEVNYILKGLVRSLFKRHVGNLTLYFTVSIPEVKVVEVKPTVTPEKKKFCMHCGVAMPLDAKFCPNCGQQPPSDVETRACRNCQAIIPRVAKFCSECGAQQPAA